MPCNPSEDAITAMMSSDKPSWWWVGARASGLKKPEAIILFQPETTQSQQNHVPFPVTSPTLTRDRYMIPRKIFGTHVHLGYWDTGE